MKSFRMLLPVGAMLILILDAKNALSGAQEGVELCIRSVIPSLFPFLFLSVLITGTAATPFAWILRPIGQLCRVPEGAEAILLSGLMGGYPVGAQAIAQAYGEGRFDRQTARRLLGFCSNAGPSFIFGFLSSTFHMPALWMLWGIHSLSAIITGILYPGGSKGSFCRGVADSVTPVAALARSVRTMGLICGWVVVFRVLLSFLHRWILWILPDWAKTLTTGILELTNGCCVLPLVDRDGLRFVLASGMLAFGGLCVALQTASVTKDLGIGSYLSGKLVQTSLSLLMAWTAQSWLYPSAHRLPGNPILPIVIVTIFLFSKFTVAFCRGRVYNERKSQS